MQDRSAGTALRDSGQALPALDRIAAAARAALLEAVDRIEAAVGIGVGGGGGGAASRHRTRRFRCFLNWHGNAGLFHFPKGKTMSRPQDSNGAMLLLTTVSIICTVILYGIYLYAGSVFPSTTNAENVETVLLWSFWSILVLTPVVTTFLWLDRFRGGK